MTAETWRAFPVYPCPTCAGDRPHGYVPRDTNPAYTYCLACGRTETKP